MNHVALMGRLTRDPETTYNNTTGNAMTRFTVAVDRKLSREKRQEMEAQNKPTADFINVVCWGRLAETVSNYTAKGKRIIVEGRIQTGSYVAQDGSRRYTTDVVADSVEFLDWKDQNDGYSTSQNFPQNSQTTNNQSNDDFFGSDFNPVDDDRIPF